MVLKLNNVLNTFSAISLLMFLPPVSLAETVDDTFFTEATIVADHGLRDNIYELRTGIANIAKRNTPTLNTAGVSDLPSDINAAELLLFNSRVQVDPDPLLNIRLEIYNPSDLPQFFTYQLLIATDVTAGPTFNNTFANIELFDDNEDGSVFINSVNTLFEVIDDPLNGVAINGSSNLGQSTFYSQFTEGKQSLFSNLGDGPNSDDFMGDGFNFLRFNINGFQLSAGDSAVITAMGCYSNDANFCAERYEIPANVVPVPAAIWFMGFGLLNIVAWTRSKV